MREQKGRVVVEPGMSDGFWNNIGWRHARRHVHLSPLLFIMVIYLISMEISTKDIIRKLMYVDDLATITENKQEALEEWKEMSKRLLLVVASSVISLKLFLFI